MSEVIINKLLDKYRWKIEHIGGQHPILREIKHIQSNTSDDSNRLIIASGMWAHQKLLKTDLRIKSFVVCPELIYSSEGIEMVESSINRADKIFIVSKKVYEKISDKEESDGLTSIIQIPPIGLNELKLGGNSFILVLDGLENPGNIGTILRTCDGSGVEAVLICNKKARVTNPKLVKASMGGVFTIPIIEVNDTSSCIKWLKDHGFNIYLADTRADRTYKGYDYNGNTALVVGSERHGISKDWYDYDPNMLSIPMLGICDSLNVGIATSIITYEISMKKLISVSSITA